MLLCNIRLTTSAAADCRETMKFNARSTTPIIGMTSAADLSVRPGRLRRSLAGVASIAHRSTPPLQPLLSITQIARALRRVADPACLPADHRATNSGHRFRCLHFAVEKVQMLALHTSATRLCHRWLKSTFLNQFNFIDRNGIFGSHFPYAH